MAMVRNCRNKIKTILFLFILINSCSDINPNVNYLISKYGVAFNSKREELGIVPLDESYIFESYRVYIEGQKIWIPLFCEDVPHYKKNICCVGDSIVLEIDEFKGTILYNTIDHTSSEWLQVTYDYEKHNFNYVFHTFEESDMPKIYKDLTKEITKCEADSIMKKWEAELLLLSK